MPPQRLATLIVLCLVAVACSTGPEGGTTTAPPTSVVVTTTEAIVPDTGPIDDLEDLAGTWYLTGPTNSAMHFTRDGEWWWAKGGLALDLKMERDPDGHVTLEDGALVFVDDTVCNGEEHAYSVNRSGDDGIEFVGEDGCLRRFLWLSPLAGDTVWNLVADE